MLHDPPKRECLSDYQTGKNNNRAGVTPMHNTNEVSRKHRGLRRAVAKEIRRYHDDLVLSLSIDNEHFMQQTFAKARSRPTRQRGERV
jgi:hypothetical protein